MGEVADMILEGVLCEGCGKYIGDPVGHPRCCSDCKSKTWGPKPKYPKEKCRVCGKSVKKGQGEKDHIRIVHGE